MMNDKHHKELSQEMFNRVAEHLLRSGVRATDQIGSCAYLTADGRMCAIGALIPEDHRSEGLNDAGSIASALNLPHRYPVLKFMFGEHEELARGLQQVHDSVQDTRRWPTSLRRVADSYGLDASIVDRIEEELAAAVVH